MAAIGDLGQPSPASDLTLAVWTISLFPPKSIHLDFSRVSTHRISRDLLLPREWGLCRSVSTFTSSCSKDEIPPEGSGRSLRKTATTWPTSRSAGKNGVRSCSVGGMGRATNGSEGKRGVEDGKTLKNGNPDKVVGMEEEDGCLINTEGDKATRLLCCRCWGCSHKEFS